MHFEVGLKRLNPLLKHLQLRKFLHVVEVVNIEALVRCSCLIDSRSEACAHDVLFNVEVVTTPIVQHLKVLLSVKVFSRDGHNQACIWLEHALLGVKQIKRDFEAKCTDVELLSPELIVRPENFPKEVVLHELQVALVDRVFGLLDETVFDQDGMNVGANHLEGSAEDVGSQICVQKGRVSRAAAHIQHGKLVLVFDLAELSDESCHSDRVHHSRCEDLAHADLLWVKRERIEFYFVCNALMRLLCAEVCFHDPA